MIERRTQLVVGFVLSSVIKFILSKVLQNTVNTGEMLERCNTGCIKPVTSLVDRQLHRNNNKKVVCI